MKTNRKLLAALAGFGLVLGACSGPGETGPVSDPYEDPGITPPAAIENPTVRPAVSLSVPRTGNLIDINVSGLATSASPEGLGVMAERDLTASDFTVVEDGVVKGITVTKISGSDTRAGADIMFVLDTTASMGPGLDSVVDSLQDFTDFLADSGLDVRVGAVTFGDAYDTLLTDTDSHGTSLMDETPPAFDRQERASLKLTADYDAFMKYLEYEARGGGRDGADVPENSLGAVEYAFDTPAFGWRSGAQRHLVVITDICSHNEDTYTRQTRGGITDPWIPGSVASVVSKLGGAAQVHVIGPETPSPYHCSSDYTNMKELTGAEATGGVFVAWDGGSTFDLTDLPITDVVTGGYIVTYRGTVDGSDHEVRLVVDDGRDLRGETTISSSY